MLGQAAVKSTAEEGSTGCDWATATAGNTQASSNDAAGILLKNGVKKGKGLRVVFIVCRFALRCHRLLADAISEHFWFSHAALSFFPSLAFDAASSRNARMSPAVERYSASKAQEPPR
jgi:hypothetical protein